MQEKFTLEENIEDKKEEALENHDVILTDKQVSQLKSLVELLKDHGLDRVRDYLRIWELPEKEVKKTVTEVINYYFGVGDIEYATRIKDYFGIPDDFLHDKKTQIVMRNGMILGLKNRKWGAAGMKRFLDLSEEEILDDKEILLAVKKGIVTRLSDGFKDNYIDDALKVIKDFDFPELNLALLVRKAVDLLIKKEDVYNEFDVNYILKICKEFNLSEQDISDVGKKVIAKFLNFNSCYNYKIQAHGSYREVIDYIEKSMAIKQAFNIPDSDLGSSKIAVEAEKAINFLIYGNLDVAMKLIEYFGLSNVDVKKYNIPLVKSAIVSYLKQADTESANEIIKGFKIPNSDVNSAIMESLNFWLNYGGNIVVNDIIKSFNLPESEVGLIVNQQLILALERGNSKYAIELANNFKIEKEYCHEILNESLIRQRAPFIGLAEFNMAIGGPNKELSFAYDVFGNSVDKDLYHIVESISTGKISKEKMKELGINKTGETGLNQLREAMYKFKGEILQESFDPQEILESEVKSKYFKSYVKFEDSEWGEHGEQSFKQVIETFVRLKGDGKIEKLPEEFTPSGEIRINRVDKEAQENFEYSEQFNSRYETLKNSVKESIVLLQEKKPLSLLAERCRQKVEIIVTEFKDKLEKQENPKAKENIQKKITELEKIKLRSVTDFEVNFSTLSQFRELHEELRQIVFFKALREHNDQMEKMSIITGKDKPDFDDIGSVINFLEHIVNEETWKDYFKNKKAQKAFLEVTNPKALEEEFSRAQNQDAKGTLPIEFIPTRNILMEFSGHVADACWASKYPSIAEKFPNFTSLVMSQNRGTKNERLSGACMLIEVNAEDGTRLLVIRGLNPTENLINSLQVDDFYKKITDYLKEIAEKTNSKLAIVIDDHSGGSGTNRPILHNYLSGLELQKIELGGQGRFHSEFNGYDISDKTFLVA